MEECNPLRSNQSDDVGAALNPATVKNSARKNNTPVDSKGNDDPMDPAMEQDEPGDGEHSPEPTSDDADPEGKIHQPVSREENSPDNNALIIPEKHSEQENLRRRLIATTRSLKKQKQRLKAA